MTLRGRPPGTAGRSGRDPVEPMNIGRAGATLPDHGPYSIPPASTVLAFESAARLGNFSRVARELGTSQSAISRHMARLETQIGARLFERSRTGVRLTEAGRRFRDAVAVGFGALRAGAADVASLSDEDRPEVTIACADEVSHLFLMPRYQALTETLGEQVRIRIQVHASATGHLPPRPPADMVLGLGRRYLHPRGPRRRREGGVEALLLARLRGRACRDPERAGDGVGRTDLSLLRSPRGGGRILEALVCRVRPPGLRAALRRVRCLHVRAGSRRCRLRPDAGLASPDRAARREWGSGGAWATVFVETARCFTAALTPEGRQRPPARACLRFFDETM